VVVSLNYAPSTVLAEEYQRIFDLERQQSYPMVDAFEQRMGFAVERERLEEAARVLSCPLKAAAPNWQHGRVLYAAAERYIEDNRVSSIRTLDIGTAKGYSALCVLWAVEDACIDSESFSVDVMPPTARVRRNTVAEVDGLKTLAEILAPWPEASRITFVESTGIDWLKAHPERIHIAFVDGKHSGSVVRQEGVLLAKRQQSGDLCIFDDVHIGDVSAAVTSLHNEYKLEYLQVLPKRAYAIGVRR
jgi:predicted O-methyltransferase YrrM